MALVDEGATAAIEKKTETKIVEQSLRPDEAIDKMIQERILIDIDARIKDHFYIGAHIKIIEWLDGIANVMVIVMRAHC